MIRTMVCLSPGTFRWGGGGGGGLGGLDGADAQQDLERRASVTGYLAEWLNPITTRLSWRTAVA